MEGGGPPAVRVVGHHELVGHLQNPQVGLLVDELDVAGHDPVGLHSRLPPARDGGHPRGGPRCPGNVDEDRPPRQVEPLQEGVETQQGGPPQVQVLGRPQLEEPGGKPLVEAGRQRLGRTRQEGPGGGLQDAEALIGQVPQQEVGVGGDGRELRLQVAHHVGQEGPTGEGRPEQGQIDVADVGRAPRTDEGLAGDVTLHAPAPPLHLTGHVPGHARAVDRDSSCCHRAFLTAHGHTPRACR